MTELSPGTLTGAINNWQPIETHPVPKDEWADAPPSVLVDNGEIVGEAKLSLDYGSWEDETPWRWTWTHRSTCSCCHSFMDPQPKWWQPLPAPAPRSEPCNQDQVPSGENSTQS